MTLADMFTDDARQWHDVLQRHFGTRADVYIEEYPEWLSPTLISISVVSDTAWAKMPITREMLACHDSDHYESIASRLSHFLRKYEPMVAI